MAGVMACVRRVRVRVSGAGPRHFPSWRTVADAVEEATTEWAIGWQVCHDVTCRRTGRSRGDTKALCSRGGPTAVRVIPPFN